MTPLYNPEAEEIVLGRVLLDPAALDGACAGIQAADFSVPGLAAAWRVVTELAVDGDVTVPLVRARLDEDGQDALTRALKVASLVGTEAHVAEVQACAVRRRQLAEIGAAAEDVKAGRGTARLAHVLELADEAAHDPISPVGELLYSARTQVGAVWGEDSTVLWASGQPLIIAGTTGIGKTTITQQLVAGRLGIMDEVLGLPVAMHSSRVLYFACDRPVQILKALQRIIPESAKDDYNGELLVWDQPASQAILADPVEIHALARRVGADTVVIDSVKDMVPDLTDTQQMDAFARAMQHCVANGVEVVVQAHLRKLPQGQGKPTINDIYGGSNFTNGAGSVIMLQGDPGDLIVDMVHLKQPAEQVGPWKVEHDHARGVSKVTRTVSDVYKALKGAPGGMTAQALADLDAGGGKATANQAAKVARRVEGMVARGSVIRLERDGTTRYVLPTGPRNEEVDSPI